VTDRRFVLEDPDLPHQITIRQARGAGNRLAVSCNCLDAPLEIRGRWDAGEAIAVWRAHMAEVGESAA
jgi:hypothetical protein